MGFMMRGEKGGILSLALDDLGIQRQAAYVLDVEFAAGASTCPMRMQR